MLDPLGKNEGVTGAGYCGGQAREGSVGRQPCPCAPEATAALPWTSGRRVGQAGAPAWSCLSRTLRGPLPGGWSQQEQPARNQRTRNRQTRGCRRGGGSPACRGITCQREAASESFMGGGREGPSLKCSQSIQLRHLASPEGPQEVAIETPSPSFLSPLSP